MPSNPMGPKQMRQTVEAMLAAAANEDGHGLEEIIDEMSYDEKLYIWSLLRSYERTAITRVLNEHRATHSD